ncbi:HET-domain-containing protein, partial [Lophium mytilinum]
MRLLHTSTFEVKSFFDQNLPPYAILSHTWGNEEVTLRELQQETTASIESTKKGFVKLVGCALQAERNGFSYIWCDTCCIDKTNSTELSEAINSMFYWYKNQLCYAYLDDVPHSPGGVSLEEDSAFARSRWFTRGWTLQELIAPRSVIFFDARWHPMGSRSQFSDFISDKTGIDRSVLNGQDPALSSIAKRMSWASRRQTTRIEDMAYSLIGLFGVNMPLLYGEREKAFLRLQEEIMKAIEDHSLFAWKTPALGFLETGSLLYSGLLATSPADFAESRNILPFQQEMGDGMDVSQPPYSMTNKGISISLPIL